MMVVLDTNVISALMRSPPEPQVIRWLDSQPAESVWTTTISLFEIRYGLHCLPKGRRRKQLQTAFERALEERSRTPRPCF